MKLISLIEKMTDGEKIELVNFLNAVRERVDEEENADVTGEY